MGGLGRCAHIVAREARVACCIRLKVCAPLVEPAARLAVDHRLLGTPKELAGAATLALAPLEDGPRVEERHALLARLAAPCAQRRAALEERPRGLGLVGIVTRLKVGGALEGIRRAIEPGC